MHNAAAARTVAQRVSSLCISHSFAAKLWKYGLAFVSIISRFLEKKRSSSSKALIVIDPAIDSAKWFATKDLVVPLILINSLAVAK